ncbi:MAG: nucleotide exchange factor GrpE [Porticoccaceae bacterium]|nr:MAG: nucleotide exchange factor GrpE [Porticoccaceae bacterium]
MSTEKNSNHEGRADESELFESEKTEVQEPVVEGETNTVDGKDSDAVDELVRLQEELVKAKDQTLRVQAEMQNLRRRSERDVENAHKYALDKFVGELLPVIDNLERALQTVDQDNDDSKSFVEGVELTLKSFQDVLVRYKVEPIDPKGQMFDPELHQAMSMLEMPEETPNTVVDVFQKGYTLNGRLVRPAMVVIAKAADK